ncbi:MAG: hypothetical protein AAF560_29595 [Acidobacteriota bacterium]
MKPNFRTYPAPGWVGGFEESNPAFAYPDPDLSSLPVLDNMANIPKLQRQQSVFWPEFSWQTIQGDPDSRAFQRFAHNISRLGYDDTGRVWSIICPQQGVCLDKIACLNVEVTVTGQRGWANESNKQMAADMGVVGTIWFSPGSHQNWLVREAWKLFEDSSQPFPSTKANAMKVTTHAEGQPDQPLFSLRSGQTTEFEAPAFAKHPEAWDVSNLSVQIGPLEQTGHEGVDTFNQKILDIFNIGSANMLQLNNVLTWDVWFTAPELVDQEEWATHAARWRHSIDTDHGASPAGSVSSPARYFDGTEVEPLEVVEEEMMKDFLESIRHLF